MTTLSFRVIPDIQIDENNPPPRPSDSIPILEVDLEEAVATPSGPGTFCVVRCRDPHPAAAHRRLVGLALFHEETGKFSEMSLFELAHPAKALGIVANVLATTGLSGTSPVTKLVRVEPEKAHVEAFFLVDEKAPNAVPSGASPLPRGTSTLLSEIATELAAHLQGVAPGFYPVRVAQNHFQSPPDVFDILHEIAGRPPLVYRSAAELNVVVPPGGFAATLQRASSAVRAATSPEKVRQMTGSTFVRTLLEIDADPSNASEKVDMNQAPDMTQTPDVAPSPDPTPSPDPSNNPGAPTIA